MYLGLFIKLFIHLAVGLYLSNVQYVDYLGVGFFFFLHKKQKYNFKRNSLSARLDCRLL